MIETTAVTQADSAQSTAEQRTDLAIPTGAGYDHWRKTGELELPKKEAPAPSTTKDEETEQPADIEDSATSSETAADSETATTQEQREQRERIKTGRASATSENRWAKVTRENRELRERLAKVEATSASRDTQQTSQAATEQARQTQTKTAATNAKPKIDDADDKGQAKYKTYDDYLDARDVWVLEEGNRRTSEGQVKTQQRQAQEAIVREWGGKVEKARTKHADYDSIALNPDLPIKSGTVVDAFILDSEHGTDVLYFLGKNTAELGRINKLNPIGQARELSKIELKFSNPAPVRRITNAPPPARTVNAHGTTAGDEVAQALKEDDFESYRSAQNARDIARRKGR